MSTKDNWPREKRWKDMYTRSEKIARARQLGFDYPCITDRQLVDREMKAQVEKRNILFICSRNQWRSPTAEQVWRSHPALSVRSAGTSPNAKRPVTAEDIRWANVILVMEPKHRSRIRAEFNRLLVGKEIHVLDIPDEYQYMDAELVQTLKLSVGEILGLAGR